MKELLMMILLGAGATLPAQEPEEIPGQAKANPDWVHTTIKNLPKATATEAPGGWVDEKAVIIDALGFCWLKESAKVYADSEAAGGRIYVARDTKGGLSMTFFQKYKFELVPRAQIQEPVEPVMQWKVRLPKLSNGV